MDRATESIEKHWKDFLVVVIAQQWYESPLKHLSAAQIPDVDLALTSIAVYEKIISKGKLIPVFGANRYAAQP